MVVEVVVVVVVMVVVVGLMVVVVELVVVNTLASWCFLIHIHNISGQEGSTMTMQKQLLHLVKITFTDATLGVRCRQWLKLIIYNIGVVKSNVMGDGFVQGKIVRFLFYFTLYQRIERAWRRLLQGYK
jgi:hypothetical protein